MTNIDNRRRTRRPFLFLGLTALLATTNCAARAPKGAAPVAPPSSVDTVALTTQQGTHILPQTALAAKYFGNDAPWFQANIPFFDCSDPELTQVYYYRWQLYKSHLKDLGERGYIVTEFLDDVSWSIKPYQSLNDATGFHIMEGRWLRDPRYVDDYIDWMYQGGNDRHFSEAIADAAYGDYLATGDKAQATKNLTEMKRIYGQWDDHYDASKGLYYIEPLYDATEFTIASIDASGGKYGFAGGQAFRPTINSFMYANALAISKLSALAGDTQTAQQFAAKSAALHDRVQRDLWNAEMQHFIDRYKANNEFVHYWDFIRGRELAGYTPWYFELPDKDPKYIASWRHLLAPDQLGGPDGIRTVEPSYQYYMKQYAYDTVDGVKKPECQWNGPTWPFQTTFALGGLANLLNDYPKQQVITTDDYIRLLKQYARLHYSNGQLDLQEDYNPNTGNVIVGLQRSHHYNHSGFNDLIITGLAGLRPRADDTLEVNPLIPADPHSPNAINYLCLENISYHGQSVTILYDRDGKHYGKGAGLSIYVNGRQVVKPSPLGRKTVTLPKRTAPLMPDTPAPANLAVNLTRSGFPAPAASTNSEPGNPYQAIDGRVWFWPNVRNYWTNQGSLNKTDWFSLDFGHPEAVSSVRLSFYGDGAQFKAPASATVQYWVGQGWADVPNAKNSPARLVENGETTLAFAPVQTSRLRVVFANAPGAATALVEMKVYGTKRTNTDKPLGADLHLPGLPTALDNLQEQNSQAGVFNGTRWRDATDGGFFAFDLKAVSDTASALVVTYWGGDARLGTSERRFDILVNGVKIGEQTLENNRPGQFFDVTYPIPAKLTQGRPKVTVRFQAKPGAIAGGVFGVRLVPR